MPRLDKDMEQGTINGLAAFKFSGVRTDKLEATEYTLVTIAVDVTGSVISFENDLRQALITAVEACQKSPRSDNLLLRVLQFSTQVGIDELHGFKPLAEIDPQVDYPLFKPDGLTPLYDAVYSSIGAMNAYARKLADDDFLANGIVFIITDGMDNHSTATPAMIKQEIKKARHNEDLESLVTVLIGVNAQDCSQWLQEFKQEADLDQYIDVGEATRGKLAKLAAFISQSVSSQSQALGTGGPSQNIAAVI